MTDTDMLYMASLEKRNEELEAKVAELEGKHFVECTIISQYKAENRQLAEWLTELKEAKRLLKAAVEDFRWLESHTEDEKGHCCISGDNNELACIHCPLNQRNKDTIMCGWNYEAEALALIGEDTNVPASADDTNVGHKSGGWISCKDKMPEDNTSVLFVYVSENGIKSVHYGYHQTVRGLGSSWGKISGGWQYCDDDVTHWQPVPEPPKDGDT